MEGLILGILGYFKNVSTIFLLCVYCCSQVDVYSFGVLLCEMYIRELPNPECREEQVAFVTNRVLRHLVRRCLGADPETRPTMQDIIDELKHLNWFDQCVEYVSSLMFSICFHVIRVSFLKTLATMSSYGYEL